MTLEWRRLGATIIGGCCHVTPEHIHWIRQLHDTVDPKNFYVEPVEKAKVARAKESRKRLSSCNISIIG